MSWICDKFREFANENREIEAKFQKQNRVNVGSYLTQEKKFELQKKIQITNKTGVQK